MSEWIDPVVVNALCTAIGGLAGAVASVQIARWKFAEKAAEKAPDVQSIISTAVAGIIKHYADALAEQTEEVKNLRLEIVALRGTVEQQNEEIAGLQAHVAVLSAELAKHGIQPPPRPHMPSDTLV
ncbi:hypothetical protein PQJ75_00570 [Rhodoplanes sp. TEM]|uniref:Uncharacterized protein n=1 Tax=Rhodoplanes tepidamans TaxID=200616 RepID=A0ABT5J6U1_RHOTP|nr:MULTISPECIES: hypothetical protein [Rhodoplanes]MDC7784745.1 hypothetical protein [Rhodoplanes tepidamans]MDC7982212.1 hypothetical protein [Rhodoplanes sp. TEM]MDQ0356217.1 ABC-type phosphate transport system substrate-binding protein [Rhodoplanes tepidamans]